MNEHNIVLDQIQYSDTLIFQCGGKGVVVRKKQNLIFLNGYDNPILYNNEGKVIEANNHPLDIVEIEKVSFNWDFVKKGMAFAKRNSYTNAYNYYYLCDYPEDSDVAIFCAIGETNALGDFIIHEKDDSLYRVVEKDKKW